MIEKPFFFEEDRWFIERLAEEYPRYRWIL